MTTEETKNLCSASLSTAGLGSPPKTDVKRFMAVASKPHAQIAGDLADAIKAEIYKHSGVPLALVIGVLRIVEKDLLDDA